MVEGWGKIRDLLVSEFLPCPRFKVHRTGCRKSLSIWSSPSKQPKRPRTEARGPRYGLCAVRWLSREPAEQKIGTDMEQTVQPRPGMFELGTARLHACAALLAG